MHASFMIPFLILGALGGTVTIEPVDGHAGVRVTAWDIRSGCPVPVWFILGMHCDEGHLHWKSTPVHPIPVTW